MSFITVAGETQIAIKQGGGGPLNVANFVLANIAALGSEPVDRIEAMPGGGDIVATLPVTDSGYVNGNQVVYSLVMDSTVGDFDFNWIGLVDDESVLIAVAYLPTISKIATAGAVPGNNMTRNFLIAFSGIAATTAIAVPASTWQIDFNARLLGIDERERLSNFDIYGQAAFFGTGWQVVRQGLTTTYDVLPGIGYVGGIRIVNAATQQVVAASPPKAVWLDVSLEGDISDMSAVVAFIVDANAHSDYSDGNGFNHYVTKIADIAVDGVETELRDSAEALYDHEAASDPHEQYLKEADVVSQAAAQAGTSTISRAWTALRVKQAIQALVQAASETVAGIAEIATQAETDSGMDDLRIVTPKKLKAGVIEKLIGIGQTWQDVTGSRTAGVTYTNSTGRPIVALLARGAIYTSGTFTIDGMAFVWNNSGSTTLVQTSMTVIIPNGSTYSNNSSVVKWLELR